MIAHVLFDLSNEQFMQAISEHVKKMKFCHIMQETYSLVYSYIQLQFTKLDFLKTTSNGSIFFALDKNTTNILILKRKSTIL